MHRRSQTLTCLILTATLARPSSALAQRAPPSEGAALAQVHVEEEVDTLVRKAERAHDQGQLEEALLLLAMAWRKRQAYDIAGNLGILELKLGRARDAAEHLDFALRYFPPTEDPARQAGLQQKFDEARGQVGAVRIEVRPPDAEVQVNGRVIERGLLAGELFVGPGAVAIAVRREGYRPEQRTLTVSPGGSGKVSLHLRREAPPPPSPPPLWPAIALGAAGVAGVGVGVGLVVAGNGEGGDAQALYDAIVGERRSCVDGADNHDVVRCPELEATAGRADTLHDAGVALWIGGGVALAGAGGYMVWRELEKRARMPATAVRMAPWVGASGAGFSVAGTF